MADNTIDTLELQVESNARLANDSLNSLVSTLQKVSKKVIGVDSALAGIGGNGLSSLASGVAQLTHAMSAFKGGEIKTADFTRIATGLNKLGTVNVQGVSDASRIISTLASNLSQVGMIKFDSAGIANIANAIANLGRKTVTQATTNIPALTQSLSGLVTGLNSIGKVNFDVTNLANLVSSITKLGGKTATNAIPNIDNLTSSLSKMMTVLSKTPKVSQNIIQMTNAMAKLAGSGSKVGAASRGIVGSFNAFGNSATKAGKKSWSLAAKIGKLYAAFWILQRGVKAAMKSVESSMDFIEAFNYFDVALEKIGQDAEGAWQENGYSSAQAYADSFKDRLLQLNKTMTGYEIDDNGYATYTNTPNLGMNPQDILNYSAMYAQMADSMGLVGETSIRISKALTMLGADWASLRNISLDTAWEKFASALAGQTRAVRSLGIDITQATLQETAYKHGLDQAVQSMDQATKTQLRLLTILDQSKVAFGDMARTIESPANQLRIFQQNIANLARTIGNLFLPIVTKVLPYVNGLIIALQRLFALLGLKIGIKESIGDIGSSIGSASGGMGDFAEDTEDASDALGDAAKNAKKLKNATLGIDELNIIQKQEESGDGNKKPSGGGGSGLLDDAIADALAEYESIWDIMLKNNKAQEIADKIFDFFKKIAEIAKPTTDALKTLWNEGLSKLMGFTWDTLGDFYREFLVPVGKWMLGDSAGLPRLIYILNDMLNNIDWGKLRTSLFNLYQALADLAIVSFDALFDFFDYFLAPLGTWVLSSALPQLVDIMTRFIRDVNWEKINTSLEHFWKALEPFAEHIGQGIINFFSYLEKIGATFINVVVPGGLEAIAFALNSLSPSQIEAIGYALGALLTAILGYKAIKGIGSLFQKFWEAIYGAQIISGVKKIAKNLSVFADTIPIVTKALTGNKNALNALATFYPKLNNAVVKVSDAFETFWANLHSGAPIANINADIKGLVGNMSNLQKGALTAVSAFFEFTIIKDSIYGLQTGTENLVVGIAKISAVAAAAGYAMYTAFGPAGIVMAAITGVVAAISGIKKAMDEVAEQNTTEAIANVLMNPGGIPLSEISSQYSEMFSSIASQFDAINQKSQELQTTQSNIDQTKHSIDTFAFAMQNGADVTATEIEEITKQFQQLVNDSSALFAQQSEIIYAGLAGSLGAAVEAAGYDISTFVTSIGQLQTESQKTLSQLSDDIAALHEQLANGEVTQEEYSNKLLDLISRYNELSGNTDEAKKSVENLQHIVSQGINLADFVDENGEIEVEELKKHFSNVADAAAEAKGSVEENGQLLIDAIQSMIDKANAIGDSETANVLGNLLQVQKQDMETQIAEIDRLAREYTQTLQDGLINKIPELVNSIEEPDWGRKLFGATREGDIQTALSEFQANTITPIENSLQEEFASFGEAGKTYASDAMGNILDGLFEYGNTDSASRYDSLRKTLTSNVQEAVTGGLDDAKKGITTSANEVGKDIDDGVSSGVNDNIGVVEDAGNYIGDEAISSTRKTLDSHSPSGEFMLIGQDVVEGFNLGIRGHKSTTITEIQTWMQSVKDAFSFDQWTTTFSNILPAFQTAWTTVTEWWNTTAIPEFWASNMETAFTIENWLQLFNNILLALQQKWLEITIWWGETALPVWWEEGVIPWFEEEKWFKMLEPVRLAFEKKWIEIFKLLDKKHTEINEMMVLKEEIMETGWDETLGRMVETTSHAFDDIQNIASDAFDSIIGKIGELNSAIAGIGSGLNAKASVSFGLSARGYASGGFPQMGDLFLANERGPELVGTFGGRTAVANNDMITRGISDAVGPAVYDAVVSALSSMGGENNNNFYINVELDSREILAAMDIRRERSGFNFNKGMTGSGRSVL